MRNRGTVNSCTLHFSSSIPPIVSVLFSGQNIRKFSKTTGPTEAKFHVASTLDRGKDGKLIEMIYVICCCALLPIPWGRGHLAGILPQIRPHSSALLAGL